MVTVVKDKKGPTYLISHRRCGIQVGEFFTLEELREIRDQIDKILKEG